MTFYPSVAEEDWHHPQDLLSPEVPKFQEGSGWESSVKASNRLVLGTPNFQTTASAKKDRNRLESPSEHLGAALTAEDLYELRPLPSLSTAVNSQVMNGLLMQRSVAQVQEEYGAGDPSVQQRVVPLDPRGSQLGLTIIDG